MSDPVPILQYAGPRHEPPLDSRLQCTHLEGGGVRFIDPPIGWGKVRGNVVAAMGAAAFAVLWLFAMIARWDELSTQTLATKTAILVGAVWLSMALWIEAKLRATKPLVIEAGGGELRVQRPLFLGRSYRWRVDQLRDIRAGVAVPWIKLGESVRMVTSLLIEPRTILALRLLENRDVNEINWVMRELRAALEMPDRID